MKSFRLKPGFLMGVATAATQIEGGDANNSWYDWAQSGHIKDGSSPLRADDHYNRLEQDVELMGELGVQVYRLGIEWSRIQPERDAFDEAAIEHYRKELSLLREKGIIPLVTLHHFTNPRWFEQDGAFEKKSCVDVFVRFVSFVVERLGDLCAEWITINEPNVYVTSGYVMGEWPPGKKSLALGMRVFRHLTLCHIEAYKAIHRIRKEKGYPGETKVSFANHLRVFDPLRGKNPIDRLSARVLEYLFQDAYTASMNTGVLRWPIGLGAPAGKGRFYDFLAVNYYTRTVTKGFSMITMPGTERNDLDWEIYPQGLTRLIKAQYALYRAPVWITENGIADAADCKRARYLFDHLYEITALGEPVERYYHWSFLDNFEWLEGESGRFGLVEVDYETQQRTIRKSGWFFRTIIEKGGADESMIPL